MTNAPNDEQLFVLDTFCSSYELTANSQIDQMKINLNPPGDSIVRSDINNTFLVNEGENVCHSYQNEEEMDSLWSLLQEDIIEIKGKSNFFEVNKGSHQLRPKSLW